MTFGHLGRLLLAFGFCALAAACGWWFVGAAMDHNAGPHPFLRTGSPIVFALQIGGAYGGFVLAGKVLGSFAPRAAGSRRRRETAERSAAVDGRGGAVRSEDDVRGLRSRPAGAPFRRARRRRAQAA